MIHVLKNTELLIALVFLYQLNYFINLKQPIFRYIIKGMILGTIGMIVMSFPYTVSDGLSIDTRSILILTSALFVPLPSYLISCAIMMVYSAYQSGPFMIQSLILTVFCMLSGILWRTYILKTKILPRWLNICFYGVLIHGMILAGLYVYPQPYAQLTFQMLAIPIMLIFPIMMLIISALFYFESKLDKTSVFETTAKQRSNELFYNPYTAILICDSNDGRIVDANPAAESLYGWSKPELLSMKLSDVLADESLNVHRFPSMETASRIRSTGKHRQAMGKLVDVDILSYPVSIDGKGRQAFIITETSSLVSEQEIMNHLELFHKVVENSLDAIFIQVGRRFVYLNPAARRLFSLSEENAIIGMRVLDRVHPDYHDEINHIISETTQNRKSITSSQVIYLTMNNKPVTVESVAVGINYNGQAGTLIITHDITSRLETLSALLSSESNFRSVVKNMPIPVFIHQSGKIIFLNRAAQQFFGASSDDNLIGSHFKRFVSENDKDGILMYVLKKHAKKNEISIARQEFIRLDGSSIFAQVGAVHINYDGIESDLIFARDLTEEIEMEKRKLEWEMQIQQKQRLESIGVLAGGIAHEINNPINGVMNYAQLILDETEPDSFIEDYVSQILKESQRVSDIVKSLLQFSRHEKSAYSFSSIYDIIDNTLMLIKVIFKNDQIELRLSLEENLPDIKCRSQQIQQVLMNLMTNSRDALNEKYPGFHESKVIEVNAKSVLYDGYPWIHLCVKDYGPGITDDVKHRLFEPFFSTKPKHLGTGLGLAISFGIIENHRGKIMVDSKINEYTEFTVALPVDNGWELLPERR